MLSFVGVVFLIPGIAYILPKLRELSALSEGEVITAFALFGVGFMAMIVYITIVSIIFALPRYAVVLDDVGAIQGIKNGFKQFMENKVAVFLLWLVIFAITLISGSFSAVTQIGGLISMILFVMVTYPLTALWWSRLYLSVKEQTEE